jgi:pimeloyl-ACP methyl ester carboxylesterase
MSSPETVSVVLVHGAWADGSSWSRVMAPLLTEERTVTAAPLPLTSFADDVAALERILERTPGKIVLVAHAYAGAVIGAARHPGVSALVYVAALAPEQGETVADVFYRAAPHPRAPQLAPDKHELIYLPQAAFAAAFAPNATEAEQSLLAAVQRPLARACIGAPVPSPRWHEVPSWYLVATQDYMIAPDTQRFMAQRMKAQIREHEVDHTPLVTAPDVVLGVIREAIAGVIRS